VRSQSAVALHIHQSSKTMSKRRFEKRFVNRFNHRINEMRSMLDGLEEVIDEFKTELDARERSTSVGHQALQHLRSEDSSGRNSSAMTDDLVEDDRVPGSSPVGSPFGPAA
jgi:hypothetical protein